MLLAVAVKGSDFQKSKDILIENVDGIHYKITLAASKVPVDPAAQIDVEIQDSQRFKAKGRPKEMLNFANALMDYKQVELDRLRAEAGVFREEKTLNKD